MMRLQKRRRFKIAPIGPIVLNAGFLVVFLAVLTSCGESGEPSGQVSVLATGANISGANGIHFAPDGRLFVASVIGNEIVVLDPDDGSVLERHSVDGPDDIAFAPDGSYFWTSILTGEVAGMTADGKRVSAGNPGPGVNPITFSDDGRLFTAQCFFDDGLFELDPSGQTEPKEIANDLGPNCGLNGMDWGPDDRLYGPRWFQGEVVSFDVDNHSMRVELDVGLQVPAAVKFSNAGVLHILDTAQGVIFRLDEEGIPAVAATVPVGLDNFAFDANDRLFVSSFLDGFVARVDAGELHYLSPGGMAHPGGIAANEDGIFVADFHALRGFDKSGGVSFTERNVLGVSELGTALTVAVGEGTGLILSSWMDNDVRIWDTASGKIVLRIGELAQPTNAIAFDGGIAIAEHGAGRVTLVKGKARTIIAEGLTAPTGLAIKQGQLYAADRATGEIWRLSASGNHKVVAEGLRNPEGITVLDGHLYALEAESGNIVQIGDNGEHYVVATIAPGTQPASPNQPPSMIFNGLATDGQALYATGETNRVLYQIDISL